MSPEDLFFFFFCFFPPYRSVAPTRAIPYRDLSLFLPCAKRWRTSSAPNFSAAAAPPFRASPFFLPAKKHIMKCKH